MLSLFPQSQVSCKWEGELGAWVGSGGNLFSFPTRIHHSSLLETHTYILSLGLQDAAFLALLGCSFSVYFSGSLSLLSRPPPLRGASSDICPGSAPSSRLRSSLSSIQAINQLTSLTWVHPAPPDVQLSRTPLWPTSGLCFAPFHCPWILPLKSLSSPNSPSLWEPAPRVPRGLRSAGVAAIIVYNPTLIILNLTIYIIITLGCSTQGFDLLTQPLPSHPSEHYQSFPWPSGPAPYLISCCQVPALWFWPHGPADSYLDMSCSFLYWGHFVSSLPLVLSPHWLLLSYRSAVFTETPSPLGSLPDPAT